MNPLREILFRLWHLTGWERVAIKGVGSQPAGRAFSRYQLFTEFKTWRDKGRPAKKGNWDNTR